MNPRYFGPRPVEYKGVVFGLEKAEHIWSELVSLAEIEWIETGDAERFGEFLPDKHRSVWYEHQAGLLVFTVRDLESFRLCGYFVCTLSTNLKLARELVATETAIYLAPPVRRGRTADKLLEYIEVYLGSKGVHRLVLSHRPENPRVGTYYQRKGYKPLCVSYFKVLSHDAHEEDEIRAAI